MASHSAGLIGLVCGTTGWESKAAVDVRGTASRYISLRSLPAFFARRFRINNGGMIGFFLFYYYLVGRGGGVVSGILIGDSF